MNRTTNNIALFFLICGIVEPITCMEGGSTTGRAISTIDISNLDHETHCCISTWSTTYKQATVSFQDATQAHLDYSITSVMPFNKCTKINALTLNPSDTKNHDVLEQLLALVIHDAATNGHNQITYKVDKPDTTTYDFFTKNGFGTWGYELGQITFYKRFSPVKLKAE